MSIAVGLQPLRFTRSHEDRINNTVSSIRSLHRRFSFAPNSNSIMRLDPITPGSLPMNAAIAMAKPIASVAVGRLDQGGGGWTSLGLNRRELTLDHTLPTGQSFRWRRTGENEYTGVIGTRVVRYAEQPYAAPCTS